MTACTACPAGKKSAAGANGCGACEEGKFSAAGSAGCGACTPGKYAGTGANSCTSCAPGTLAPHPGQKSARSAQPESTHLLAQRLVHHVRQVRIWTRQALAVVTRLLLAHSLEVVPLRTLAALRVLTQRTEQVRALLAKQEPSQHNALRHALIAGLDRALGLVLPLVRYALLARMVAW